MTDTLYPICIEHIGEFTWDLLEQDSIDSVVLKYVQFMKCGAPLNEENEPYKPCQHTTTMALVLDEAMEELMRS